jgi:hypothetical protein
MKRTRILGGLPLVVWAALGGLASTAAGARSSDRELAQQLANPLASLVSVPLQYNQDQGVGSHDDRRRTLNLQPVVPLRLGRRWKVISRTVLPLVEQEGAGRDGGALSGLGDVTQSWFFTPAASSPSGWLVGAGPVAQAPSGTEERLTSDRWSVGPTAVAVRQAGHWTYGGLANHLASFAGDERRAPVSSSFVQPFLAYVTATRTTVALNAEGTYDWRRSEWSVPLHLTVSQLLKLGPQPLNVFVAARYWATSPEGGPTGWGLRYGITLLFGRRPS